MAAEREMELKVILDELADWRRKHGVRYISMQIEGDGAGNAYGWGNGGDDDQIYVGGQYEPFTELEGMKKRSKKKAEDIKRRLIHEVLDAVLDINGLNPRLQEETGNLPTAFLCFSGHVGAIEVSVHLNGWKAGDYADKECIVRTYRGVELKGAIAYLKKLKNDSPAAPPAEESGN